MLLDSGIGSGSCDFRHNMKWTVFAHNADGHGLFGKSCTFHAEAFFCFFALRFRSDS